MTPELAATIRTTWRAALNQRGLEEADVRNANGHLNREALRCEGIPGPVALADQFGVSACAVSQLLSGKTHRGFPCTRASYDRHITAVQRQEWLRTWISLGGPAYQAAPRAGRPRGCSPLALTARHYGISRQRMWAIVHQYERGEITLGESEDTTFGGGGHTLSGGGQPAVRARPQSVPHARLLALV